MKQLFGLILLILAIPMALYVALWLCFIGGLVEIFNSIKATPIDTLHLAYGLAKLFCTSLAGIFTFWVLLIPGFGFLLSNNKTRHNH